MKSKLPFQTFFNMGHVLQNTREKHIYIMCVLHWNDTFSSSYSLSMLQTHCFWRKLPTPYLRWSGGKINTSAFFWSALSDVGLHLQWKTLYRDEELQRLHFKTCSLM